MKSNHQLHGVIFVLFIASSLTTVSAQIPTKLWDARFGGSKLDIVDGVVQTSDNGFILVGVSASNNDGDKSQMSRGKHDYWVVKIDANGVMQWDKRFGGSDDDGGYDIQSTLDGNYLVSGYSSSGISGDKSEASHGNKDFWIIKMTPDGDKIWDHCYGGTNGEILRAALCTSDGGFLLAGYSFSGISGNKTQANKGSAGTSDYWIIKVDANGAKQWDRSYGGDGEDELTSMVATSDGGFMLAGSSNSTLSSDHSQASQGLNDFWIVKINSVGNKLWDFRYGGTDDDFLIALTNCDDGGYVLDGYSFSGIGGDKTQDCWGNSDIWMVKIDSVGVKEWDVRFGGSDMDRSRYVIQTQDGGYFLAGYTISQQGDDISEPSYGEYDAWVVKVAANGSKEWDRRYGGDADDHCHLVMQLSNGNYILVAHSMSGISGDKTQSNFGDDDFWILELGYILPIELAQFDVHPQNSGAILDWTTLSEIDNNYFTIQRSLDAVNFDSIGVVRGAGTSSLEHTYSFVDENPPKQTLYYRLKQTDFKGTSDFSEVKSLNLQSDNSIKPVEYYVYPNPAINYLVFESSATVTTDAVMEMRNVLGALIFSIRIPGSTLREKIDLPELAAGYYTVSIKNSARVSAFYKILINR